ncbi:MAG: carbonic anhydrase family protein [Oligoflexales bacterium]|nr:carbonic anhydrase family protein [Oligoflexales bacterium]
MDPSFLACEAGKYQSPIDIKKVVTSPELKPVTFSYFPGVYTIENKGYTFSLRASGGPYITVDGGRYDLEEIVFHSPSEHKINSTPFDMEIQLMHINNKLQKLNISVFVREGSFNKAIEDIWKVLGIKKGIKRQVAGFDPKLLLPRKRSYLTYPGSETIPPCSEGIQWVVFEDHIQFSSRQIDEFEAIYGNNSRPVQESFARIPLRSH